MSDLAVLLIVMVASALSVGFVILCDRLMGKR